MKILAWCCLQIIPAICAEVGAGSGIQPYQTVPAQGARRWGYHSGVTQWFSTLQAVQEGAGRELLSDRVPWPGLEGGTCPQPFLVASGFQCPVRNLLNVFVVGGGVCLAEQARYLLKEPTELALLSLDRSNRCLLRELEVFGGCENFAGVQAPSVTPRLADSCSFGNWKCCCCILKSEECSEGDCVCHAAVSCICLMFVNVDSYFPRAQVTYVSVF